MEAIGTHVKYYFANHAAVVLSLFEIEAGGALANLRQSGAGSITKRSLSIGISDGQGKPVFEGDIVEYTARVRGKLAVMRGVISWKNGFIFQPNHTKFIDHAAIRVLFKSHKGVVIGNIDENPELIPS